MDKLTLGLLADILYFKGIICFEEFEALQEMRDASDIEPFVEKLARGEFNVYKRGETYIDYAK
jgi:hypothetical protein